MGLLTVSLLALLLVAPTLSYNALKAVKVRSEIALTGRVITNEDAIKLLQRQSQVKYQTSLPKYLAELKSANRNIEVEFNDVSFTVVGSLATLDASITFVEGIENVNVVIREMSAGFKGKPNPTNDKLHTSLQRLNVARNIVWLVKEKLRNGVVTADSSLMDRLREAQTWLSTQTGGHLGQGMTFALEKAGLTKALKANWGASSLKYRSFSAAVGNGLDFVINGYNTVVNSMALNQEISTPNILALTSSVTAMAGDIAMGVAQVLETSAKVATAAGPIGYAIAATLYVASYATGVASGLTSQENLEAKDYVKAFLGPLIPDPTFGATVEMFDHIAKGRILDAYQVYLTQSFPAVLAIGGMAVIDRLTGSTALENFLKGIRVLRNFLFAKRYVEFYDNLALNVAGMVRSVKPKSLRFAYPYLLQRDHYDSPGWRDESSIKDEFNVTSELSAVQVFLATYNSGFSKPLSCPKLVKKGFTFCPKVAPHNEDKLIFMGSRKVNDKVQLDDNCEAYGMGGDDHFELKAGVVKKGVKINGGEGSDTIDVTNSFFGSRNSVTGGGPERDVIKSGPGDDTILVNNDTVTIANGDNTLLVEGNGTDKIEVGTGADLVIIQKSGGSMSFRQQFRANKRPDQNKAKRIVYDGEGRSTDVDKHDIINGGPTQSDILTMRNYEPGNSRGRIALLEESQSFDSYFRHIADIKSSLFKGHENEFVPGGHMEIEAQRIYIGEIERFELSIHSAINLVLLKRGRSDYYEVIGGPNHDFVINLDGNVPLLAQLATGDNRVLSGKGDDAYSVILDAGQDYIFDEGGENILAILLPQGQTFRDVHIGRSRNVEGYKIEQKSGQHRSIEYIFRGETSSQDRVQIIVEESTGKQITFQSLASPRNEYDTFSTDRPIDYYYDNFEFCPGDQAVVGIVEGIAPPFGKQLKKPGC